MLPPTPRLQLKRPDGGDPFKRQDFIENWDKLDAAPGTTVCTSTGRPTWGTAQSGRRIYESDTRAEYIWTGTAFLPFLTAPSGWLLGVEPGGGGATLNRGGAATYTLGSITTTRPGSLMIDLTAVLATANTLTQNAWVLPYVNGASIGGSSINGFTQWDGSGGSYNNYSTVNVKGYKAVAKGTYTIQGRVQNGTINNVSLLTRSLMASIILFNETSR